MNIKSIVRFLIPKTIRIKLRQYERISRSKVHPIIKNPHEEFEILYHIKDATWETVYAPAIYGIAKERIATGMWPAEDIFLIKHGIVCCASDTIRTPKGVWWNKYNDNDFVTCAIPGDCNVLSFNRDTVTICPNKKNIRLSGKTLSLIGVYSHAWSHFLFEFVSKMYYAGEAGLLNQDVFLLTDEYNDSNIEDVINNYITSYPKVRRIIAKKNTDYICEELICMRETGSNYNDVKFFLFQPFIIPSNVTNMVQKYIVKPYIQKIKNRPAKHTKIYLSRHSNRILNNTEEVEKYFKDLGFYFIEGQELSLEEKADLFYHAEVVVGPHSSAWQNIIFCNKVKCLMFCNYRYVEEVVFSTMAKENVESWLNVSGFDDNEYRRSNYTISLEKIKSAYDVLINNKEHKPLS